jgi:hypothetical protein
MALLAAPGVDLKAEQDSLSQGDEHVGWLVAHNIQTTQSRLRSSHWESCLKKPSCNWKKINPSEARAMGNGLVCGGEPKLAESLLRCRFPCFFCNF